MSRAAAPLLQAGWQGMHKKDKTQPKLARRFPVLCNFTKARHVVLCYNIPLIYPKSTCQCLQCSFICGGTDWEHSDLEFLHTPGQTQSDTLVKIGFRRCSGVAEGQLCTAEPWGRPYSERSGSTSRCTVRTGRKVLMECADDRNCAMPWGRTWTGISHKKNGMTENGSNGYSR